MAEKVWALIFTWVVIISQIKGDEFKTIGDLNFTCPDGWQFIDTTCYMSVPTIMEFEDATDTCQRYFSNLTIMEDEIENKALTDQAKSLGWNSFWNGEKLTDKCKGYWDVNQPPADTSAEDCAAIFQNGRWRVVSCQSRLPFFCKKPACIDGTFDCGNGKCLSINWLCDGVNDCGNNLDEMKCKSRCAETQTGVSDVITFNKNAGNTDCTWTLVSPSGSQIVLTFSTIRFSGSDSLEVRIGGQTLSMSTVLDTLSGSHDNKTLYSNNNMAVLRFVSDSSNTNSQFELSWTSNEQELSTTTTEVDVGNDWTSLTSPFYPNPPPRGFYKEWLVSSSSIVTAKIDSPDLSPEWSLIIYDGEGYDDVIVKAENASDLLSPSIYMSRHSKIRVVIKGMDTSGGGKGIRVNVKSGCSVDVEASSGVLLSPGYWKSVYPSSTSCSWTVKVPSGTSGSLKLNFLEFNLHDDGKDKIEIYDGLDATGTALHMSGGYMGNLISSPPSANGNSLYVVFTSSVIQNNGRFKFEFSADCPEIPDSPNLSKSSNDTSYDSKVEVTCETGYSFPQEELYQTPALTFTCMKGGNWDRPRFPTCQIVHCGAPPPIEFGYVSNYSGVATYQNNATYMCYSGFELDGNSVVKCQENGNWTARPSCTSSVCGDPPSVAHSRKSRKVGNGTSFGTVIEYECDEGYEILSSPRILCQKNSSWSQPTPSCTEKLCPLPAIENSLPLSETSPVKFGASVDVTCMEGYVASSTNTSSASLTCKSNQTFDLITCTDKNECDERPCQSSETCMNKEGSYICDCKPGYRKMEGGSCQDIDECTDNSSGCEICTNSEGSYSCRCNPGYSLFVNGTSGVYIHPGETGQLMGDVYRENHTCVRNRCQRPNDVQNGTIHSQRQWFWFEDQITYSCNLGYIFEGSSTLKVSRQCQANGSWSGTDPVCQAAKCTAQDREGIQAQKDQVKGIYPRTDVKFADTVIIECKKTDGSTFNKTRFCAYDANTQNYTLQGDSPICPVVNCGKQENIAGQVEVTLDSTVYGTRFEFQCETGANVAGLSTNGNYTVTCQSNGHWGYGNLTCLAAKCPDPGTLGGTTQQKMKSYEQGQTVTYECERLGFKPIPYHTIKCVYDNGNAAWNSTAPSCKDTTPPTFKNGTIQEVWIDRMKAPMLSPDVKDNSGLVVKISTPVLAGFDASNPVMENLTVDYVAADGSGNEQRFQYKIYVRDYTPGTLTCPQYIQLKANSSSTIYNIADNYITSSGGQLTSDLQLTASLDTVGTVTYHRMSLRTEHGTETTCAFSVEIVASACYHELTSAPANGKLEPSSTRTGDIFTVAVCNNGYAFSDGTMRRNYTCTGQNVWTPAMPVEDCQPYSTSGYSINIHIDLRSTSPVFSDSPCMNNFKNMYNMTVKNQLPNDLCRLQGKLNEYYSFTVTEINFKLKPPYDNEVELTLRVENSDGSLESLQTCQSTIKNAKEELFKYELFKSEGCQYNVSSSSLGVNETSSGESCDPGYSLTEVDGSKKCLPCPLGSMYMSGNGQCMKCPSGQYQDEAGQSSCKSCASGQVSILPRTMSDHCKNQCSDGFVSASGLPPCSPCPADTYWENSTQCTSCPANGSTLYTQAAANISICAAPCSAGHYSRTGYEPCTSCPRNFYQEQTGQIVCVECQTDQATDTTGSTAATDCKSTGDSDTCLVNCDATGTENCTYLYHRAFCTCKPGYTGARCESTIDYCLSNPCLNGANCSSDANGFTCACQKEEVCVMELNALMYEDVHPQSSERYLENTDEETCKTRCVNRKECVAAVFMPAPSNSCSLLIESEDTEAKDGNSDSMTSSWGRYFDKNCSVRAYFDGAHCERDVRNDCDNDTCSNYGVCRDLVNGTECVCSTSGKYMSPRCERATNLCETNNCDNGGTCTAWEDIRHQCTCPPGYTGDRCQTEIDECKLNPTGCLYNGQCVDAVDGYSCNCTQSSGQHCEVITPLCPSTKCQHGLCVHNYHTATAECVCENPYENSTDGSCTPTDFCASSPCTNGNSVRCESQKDGYRCVCQPGYQGSRCQHNTDDCVGNTCIHGKCEDGNDTFTCICEPGYTGSRCESDIDDCEGQCTHGNSSGCTDLLQDFACICQPGFTGKNCTDEINECDSLPCQHGGMCVDEFNRFRCNCTEAWEGDTCEQERDQCGGVSCQNDAECFNLFDNYFCSCPPGTEGELCGTSPEVCTLLDPCTNKGTCQQLGGTAFCNCSANPEYTGLSCELIKDSCKDPDTCQNGGTCLLSSPTGYTCKCLTGSSGPRCETTEDVCDSKCPAGVECVQEGQLTFCLCPAAKVLTASGCQDSSSDFDLFLDSELGSQPLESAPFRLSGDITLMFWVGYFSGGRSLYLSDVNDEEQYFEMYEDQIKFFSENKVKNFTLDPNKNLKTVSGSWDHVAVTWTSQGDIVVYINGIQVREEDIGFDLSSTKLKRVRVDSSFTGYVSQVSLWNTSLSTSNITSSINATSFMPSGVRALGWTSGYKMTTGTRRFMPSKAALAAKLCDSDRIRSDSCEGAKDKMAPVLNDCPSEPRMTRVSDKRVVETEDVVTTPSTDSNLQILTTIPEDVLSWGRYDVVYAAKDVSGNYGLCRFKTYITERDTCDKTGFLQQNSCGENAIESFCSSDSVPSVPSPNVLQCSKRGSYNLDSPLEPFVPPVCGAASSQRFSLDVTLTYTLAVRCYDFTQRSTETDIKAKIVNVIKPRWPDLCSDCNSINITSACDGNNVMVTLHFTDLPERLTKFDATVSLKADEIFLTTVKESDDLDLSGLTLRKNDVRVLLSPSCNEAVEADKCVVCGAGTYFNSTAHKCVYCPPGSFTSTPSQTSCTPCDDGKITLSAGSRAADQCVEKCSAGQYYDAGECKPCPVGFYQHEQGKSFCYPCPPNKITSGTGTSKTNSCFDDCPSGTQLLENSTCSDCPQGFYRTQSIHDKCQPCNSGNTTKGPRSKSASDCVLPACGPGHYINNQRECVLCKEGSYQPIKWQRQCINCSESFTTENKGSSNSSDCRFVCPEGRELTDKANQTCSECPAGKYRDNSLDRRFLPCQNCSEEFTTSGTGSKNVSDCAIKVCTAGQKLTSDHMGCDECPVDTYQPESLPMPTTQCLDCETGKGTENPRSTSESDCKPFCGAGQQYNNSKGQCEDCPQGTYQTGLPSARFEQCVACSNASFTTVGTGAVSNDNCTLRNCEAGYKIISDMECSPCGYGFYQPERAKDTCVECGTSLNTSSETSTRQEDCTRFCGIGEQGQNGNCTLCPEDTYKNTSGYAVCSPCTGSLTSDENRKSCTITYCDYGFENTTDKKCVECAKGFYKDSRGNSKCTPCPKNFTTEVNGAKTAANCSKLHCEPGLFDNGTEECVPCPSGFYKNVTGAQACTQCALGKTTEGEGAIRESQCSVENCSPGQFRPPGDRETCTACPVGQYQPNSGLTKCINCEEGFTTLKQGSDSSDDCLPICSAGQYLNESSRSCRPCPLGTYMDKSGMEETCTPCPLDTTTAASGSNSSSQCNIDDCRPGRFRTEKGCQICGQGKYQPLISQSSCEPCEEGHTTRLGVLDATSPGQCILDCPEGQERNLSNTSECRKCPNGQYRKKELSDSCAFCPPGQTTSMEGATSCVDFSPDVTNAPQKVLLTVRLRFTLKSCTGIHNIVYQGAIEVRIKLRIKVQAVQFPGLCNQDCNNIKITINIPCGSGGRKKRQTSTIDAIVQLENVPSQLPDKNNSIWRSTQSLLEEVLGDDSLVDDSLKALDVTYGQIYEIASTPDGCVEGAVLDNTNCVWCEKGTRYLDSMTCEACPVGQYQDTIGQTTCKQCPGKLSTRRNGTSSEQDCTSVCILDPNYCHNGGICRNGSAAELSCLCTEKYTGDRCEMRLALESELPAIIIGVCVGIFCVLVAILVIGWCCYRRRPQKHEKDNWSRITPPIDYVDYNTPALTPRSHIQMHKHIQFPNSSYTRSVQDVQDFYQSEWE